MTIAVSSRAGAPRPDRAAPPPWVWPSIVLGIVYPQLSRSARRDVDLLDRLVARLRVPDAPHVNLLPFVPVVAALGITVPFSLLRLGIVDAYTESIPFLVLGFTLGMLSPAAGLLVALFHALFDLAGAAVRAELEPFLPALAGRLVSIWLLWLLVVAIPLMSRALPGATMAAGQPADPILRRVLAFAAAAITATALALMWALSAPYLVRPLFVWRGFGGPPTFEAINPIQSNVPLFAVLAGVLVLAVTALRWWAGSLDEEVVELSEPEDLDMDDIERPPQELEFLGRVMTHVVTMVILGGLITGAVDVVILFAVLLLARPLTVFVVRHWPVAALVTRIPWVLRFLAAFALTYLAGLVVTSITYQSQEYSTFFPLVITVAVGLLIFQVVLGIDEAVAEMAQDARDDAARGDGAGDAVPANEATAGGAPAQPGTASGGTSAADGGTGVVASVAILAAALAVASLLSPGAVRADNCSSIADCNQSAQAGAASAAAAAAAAGIGVAIAASRAGSALAASRGAREDADRRGRRPRRRRRSLLRRSQAAGAEREHAAASASTSGVATSPGTAVRPSDVARRIRDRALRNYYGRG